MTLQRDDIPQIVDGTLLIEDNTALPETSLQENGSSGGGWTRISNRLTFEKKLSTAGWTFFFMAGTIRANVFGFDRTRGIATAVKRLIAIAQREKCNCLEIDLISSHTFFGMPYVTVAAHSRHIQAGVAFAGAALR